MTVDSAILLMLAEMRQKIAELEADNQRLRDQLSGGGNTNGAAPST